VTHPASYNHPSEPIRHSYPVAISDAGLSTALGLVLQTMPYILVRFGILVAATIISVLWFGITIGGAGFLGGKIHPWVGFGWFIAGCGIYGWVWGLMLRYALYLIKCGHIAVLTELMTTGKVENGTGSMFEYGKRTVTQRFGEVNVLFAVDILVDGVVRTFNRTLEWFSSIIPIPGFRALVSLVTTILHAATTYLDETIFSYNLARGEDNPWRGGKDGIIYYCQNNKEILKTAAWCVLFDYLLTGVAWVIMLAPAALLTSVMPLVGGWTFLVAILFALNFRQAFLKPLFLTMIMCKFHLTVKGQVINEDWDAKLTRLTPKFTKIKDNIAGHLPGPAATTGVGASAV
jgi:hypothetical protein